MEAIERKHFEDVAKGLAYYILATLSEIESEEGLDLNPNYLTNLVITRLSDINYDEQKIRGWLLSESLRESILSIFTKNLKYE